MARAHNSRARSPCPLASSRQAKRPNNAGLSATWLRDRLSELRQQFDYTVLYGPPAGAGSEAALLASLCDGMVLVLEADSTRRVAAQKVKEKLHSANARLLGAILSERTFPIPETIYKNL